MENIFTKRQIAYGTIEYYYRCEWSSGYIGHGHPVISWDNLPFDKKWSFIVDAIQSKSYKFI
jgi:hypothetical protein